MNRSILLPVNEASRVGEARRQTALLARHCGLGETDSGRAGVVVTEAVTNILKHAGQGQIVLRALDGADGCGIEFLAVDKGPGMANVSRCLEDGYSTAGSPGTGLGAISRMSTIFELYSQQGKGTVLLAQVRDSRGDSQQGLEVGVVCAPMQDEKACGDAWAVRNETNRSMILVVDGLGHGPLAAHAADEAVRVFNTGPLRSGPDMIQSIHGPLRSTRGASLAVAEIDYAAKEIRFTGVGNISGQIWLEGRSRSMVSHNGTVGHEVHRIREFVYPWAENSIIVMHSDGILSRWNFDPYPGLLQRHPSLVAGVLFRDYWRGRDDVTALVAKSPRRTAST